MRPCSIEGVLQLATCNRIPEVGWKNRGGICQQLYNKEGPHLGSLPPLPKKRDCMSIWVWLGVLYS